MGTITRWKKYLKRVAVNIINSATCSACLCLHIGRDTCNISRLSPKRTILGTDSESGVCSCRMDAATTTFLETTTVCTTSATPTTSMTIDLEIDLVGSARPLGLGAPRLRGPACIPCLTAFLYHQLASQLTSTAASFGGWRSERG